MPRGNSISENQVLQVLRDRDRDHEPVLATSDVAERTGVTSPTAKDRLDALVEEGRVKTKVYGRAAVYWPADERITSDPDPISGGLAEEVDVVAEANGERWAATVRRLVELGLEAEEADVRPGEIKAEYEAADERAERYQDEADTWREYAFAGALVTAGILGVILGGSLPSSALAIVPFASLLVSGIQTVGALATVAGFAAWGLAFLKNQRGRE